jgi:hypothetical protein
MLCEQVLSIEGLMGSCWCALSFGNLVRTGESIVGFDLKHHLSLLHHPRNDVSVPADEIETICSCPRCCQIRPDMVVRNYLSNLTVDNLQNTILSLSKYFSICFLVFYYHKSNQVREVRLLQLQFHQKYVATFST